MKAMLINSLGVWELISLDGRGLIECLFSFDLAVKYAESAGISIVNVLADGLPVLNAKL